MKKTRKDIAEIVETLIHSDSNGLIVDFTLNISCVGDLFEAEYKTYKQGELNIFCLGDIFEVEYKTHKQGELNIPCVGDILEVLYKTHKQGELNELK